MLTYVFRNIHIHIHLCIEQQLMDKEAMNFRESKDAYIEGFEWRKETRKTM